MARDLPEFIATSARLREELAVKLDELRRATAELQAARFAARGADALLNERARRQLDESWDLLARAKVQLAKHDL